MPSLGLFHMINVRTFLIPFIIPLWSSNHSWKEMSMSFTRYKTACTQPSALHVSIEQVGSYC